MSMSIWVLVMGFKNGQRERLYIPEKALFDFLEKMYQDWFEKKRKIYDIVNGGEKAIDWGEVVCYTLWKDGDKRHEK